MQGISRFGLVSLASRRGSTASHTTHVCGSHSLDRFLSPRIKDHRRQLLAELPNVLSYAYRVGPIDESLVPVSDLLGQVATHTGENPRGVEGDRFFRQGLTRQQVLSDAVRASPVLVSQVVFEQEELLT